MSGIGSSVPHSQLGMAGRTHERWAFAISRELFRLADRDRRLYRAAFGRFGSAPLLARKDQELFEWVRREFLSLSALTEQSVALAARTTVCAFLGLLRSWLDGDQPLTPDDVSDAFVSLTLPGVATFPGVEPGRLMTSGDATS